MAKKIQFMIPKAKLAFFIEQVLLFSTETGLVPETPFELIVTLAEVLKLTLEQFS